MIQKEGPIDAKNLVGAMVIRTQERKKIVVMRRLKRADRGRRDVV